MYITNKITISGFLQWSLLLCVCLLAGCKDDWLDAKPEKTLLIPTSIQDYQAILDNTGLFNMGYPALGEVSADDYYLDYETWLAGATMQERQCYLWADDIYGGEAKNYDWDPTFKKILYANIVLEGIEKITPKGEAIETQLNEVKGTALFFRGLSFFTLSELFCKPYHRDNLQALGLPLRLNSNINLVYQRSSLEETFTQILADLHQAERLLPLQTAYKTRPSKTAVQALLARVYLCMHDYEQAAIYASVSLGSFSHLLDFSELDSTLNFPFKVLNDEVSFHYTLNNYAVFSRQAFNVDTLLYNSYHTNDLRKNLFFARQQELIKYKGSYSGTNSFFGGLTSAEMYLTAAEALARMGRMEEASGYLHTLLASRSSKESFQPIVLGNQDKAIRVILSERRKELVFRGVRWADIRRLNAEGAYAITMKRFFNGSWYELRPNDNKYVLPIGADEIRLGNLQQNER